MTNRVVSASNALDPDSVRAWIGDAFRASSHEELSNAGPYPLLDTRLKDACEKIMEGAARRREAVRHRLGMPLEADPIQKAKEKDTKA